MKTEPPVRKTTVLLVDDDSSVRNALFSVLEMEGYQTIMAPDGVAALDYFQENAVDIVLLDLCMPRKNGWDTFERLTSANPLLPTIIITGQPDQYQTAEWAGVGALLEKPLNIPTLLATIKELLAEPPHRRLMRLSGRKHTTRYCLPDDEHH